MKNVCESYTFFPDCLIESGVRYEGSDIDYRTNISSASQEACSAYCRTQYKCQAWTYNLQLERCWLKEEQGGKVEESQEWVTGSKLCGGGQVHRLF